MIEWDVPFRLDTPAGIIEFNDPTPNTSQGYYVLIEENCKAMRGLRTPFNQIPQADGEIFHRRFRNGTELTLAVALWADENSIACEQIRREMYEALVASLDSILNGNGRLYWQPSGYGDERMLDFARWLTPIDVSYNQGVPVCTFTIDSPLPYVIDKTQREDSPGSGGILVSAGVPRTITLPEWSAPFWPVIQVYPDTAMWSVINTSVTDEYGDQLIFFYDADRPGAIGIPNPHYAEIDTFRETIYYDGNQANLKPGVDPEVTDFWYLQPGDNIIEANNCDALFLINNAWAVA